MKDDYFDGSECCCPEAEWMQMIEHWFEEINMKATFNWHQGVSKEIETIGKEIKRLKGLLDIPILTSRQIQVIKCAHADLAGVYQSVVRDQNVSSDMITHDWDAHRETIEEMEHEFDFIEHIHLD
jgi:hypothetical protein